MILRIPCRFVEDERWYRIPKQFRAACLGAWVSASCWTVQYGRDGWFPGEIIEAVARDGELEELVRVGFVVERERDGFLGFFLVDHLAANPTRSERERAKRRAAERKVSPSLRAEVIARDGYRCGICLGDVYPDDVHIDHVIPVSRNGATELHNLRVTHSQCNMRRGNRS